jgi:hypothetical protein
VWVNSKLCHQAALVWFVGCACLSAFILVSADDGANYNYKNASSSLMSCLSTRLIYSPCIALLSHFLKDHLNRSFVGFTLFLSNAFICSAYSSATIAAVLIFNSYLVDYFRGLQQYLQIGLCIFCVHVPCNIDFLCIVGSFFSTVANAKNSSYLRRVMEYRDRCYFIVQISQAFMCHSNGIPDI